MDPVEELVAALPPSVVVTAPEAMEKYRFDWSRDASAGMPLAVVRVEEAAQVQETMRWAARHNIGIVPRGAGTGLSGGSTAVDGAIVLSLERMRSVEIDPDCQVAVVEPGAFNAEVKAAAGEHGLWYPPDPSSFDICSIGGNIATNAGGLCCVKYGVTTDYVLGLDVVLADGTLVSLGGKRIKDVAGLSLLKLFVGSEGTLGIVTRAILRLVPRQEPAATLVATFADAASAATAVVETRRRMRPSMMEFMDGPAVRAVEEFRPMGLDVTCGAMLVAQSDAPGAARSAELELMRAACVGAGARDIFMTDDPTEGELFVAARRAFFPAMEAQGSLLMEDVGVPIPLLPDLLIRIEQIGAKYALAIPTVAHAGDGNTHPNIVYDAAESGSRERAHAAFVEVMTAAIELGGTITGEHGVGRAKKIALPDQLGPDVMALTRRIKAALDPHGILNPGAIL